MREFDFEFYNQIPFLIYRDNGKYMEAWQSSGIYRFEIKDYPDIRLSYFKMDNYLASWLFKGKIIDL